MYSPRAQLSLKYIVLPGINDNEEDYISLMNLMNQLGAETLEISRDLRFKFTMTDSERAKLIDSAARLVQYCSMNDIMTSMIFYSPEEEKSIQSQVKNSNGSF